ncbi:hypothetical protein [Algivirga pacifica]|uniref:PorV/PorQ family protein n=1 Tax=Algivirga pacifica TaxID=1162670 RepID=A0ABP9DA01_9BACT
MRYLIFIIFIGLSLPLSAQITAPKYSNEYLFIGAGARGLAMGNTQVAIVDDATSGYWNPAGMLQIDSRYSGALMHAQYFGGIANYDYASFVGRVDQRSRFGVSVIRFAVDDIPDTRYLFDNGQVDYSRVTSFSAADYAFIFSYAHKFNLLKDFNFGANAKVLYRNVGIFANAWGFGLDFGLQTEISGWQLGVVGKDITTTFNAWSFNQEALYDIYATTGNTLPNNSLELTLPRLMLGVGRDIMLWKGANETRPLATMLLSAGLDLTFDGPRNTLLQTPVLSGDPHAGVEFAFYEVAFVRGGIGGFQAIKGSTGGDIPEQWVMQPSFGIGVKLKTFTLDYAFSTLSEEVGGLYSHTFSLKADLEASKNKTPRYQKRRAVEFY